jgi:serine-type D-Ala-D-Ala carboxypeptidase/endopeptidase (penicillin-binding protein 4)
VSALLACASAAAAPAPAAAPTALWRQLDRALVVPGVSRARSAAIAVDLASGRILYERNQMLALAPASNEKLAVTFTALTLLGAGHRTETTVLGAGSQQGPVWHGNLVLKGYGDPTLTRGRLGTLVARVKRLGIRRVTGRVVGDESFFDRRRTGPGWKASFYLAECPPLSALVVDRARVGRVLTRAPAETAAAAFSRALKAAGVSVAGHSVVGVAPPTATPLTATASPPLWRTLRFMDRESDNFTAEMLLKQLGALYGGAGTSAAGAAVVRRTLASAGVSVTGVRIVDGSGLSGLDRMTAEALLGILQAAWSDPRLRTVFARELSVAGVNGTLQYRMRQPPARGNVVAKTGTTSLSSALSGYAKGRFAFSILNNGNPIASWWAERGQDRFAMRLARIQKLR